MNREQMRERPIDVYCIGNALVDIEVQVTDTFLSQHGIEKGLMTLVEEERQNELLVLLEQLQIKKASGGSAANTALAIAQFGGKSYYACKVARDSYGEFFREDLIREGVQCNNAMGLDGGKTGKCLVMVTPDAERTLNTYLGISSTFGVKELDAEVISRSKYLYIEGYLVSSDPGYDAILKSIKIAHQYGVKVAFSFSDPFISHGFKKRVDEIIGLGTDLIFCNKREALGYTGGDRLEEAFTSFRKLTKSFVVTVGPDGCYADDGKQGHFLPGHDIKALDTTGAGDMFAGAFLYAVTHGKDFKSAGVLANLSASKVVERFGPRMERSIIENVLNQMPSDWGDLRE
jgi:sugar/nucleoside kinase (ribokinase family)